jgi:LacI family transcriptional regulator, galactose operon repressor
MKRSRKNGKSQKLDIRSVASLAKVSIATVSRTINRISTVDPVLAARVWKAVEELNYFPNTQARALVSGRSRLLGLIVSEITNPFFPELIQEFENFAVELGYEILICSTNYDRKRMESCVRRMLERKVDGVAIMTFGIEELLLDRFAIGDIPAVFVDDGPEHRGSSILTVDYKSGIFEGVQHLAALGHSKIGFISGPLKLRSSELRRRGFLESLRSAGIKPEKSWIIEGNHTLAGGRDAMARILGLPEWPTAIMCSNDMTAIGVQHALFESKLLVPEDFSLIGFDDVHLAEYTIPPLSTVRMSCKDLAQAAVFNLVHHIEPSRLAHAPTLQIPTSLIVRQTTGRPRKAVSDTKKPRKTKKTTK